MDQQTRNRFFGYGSLVNLSTHQSLDPRPVTIAGWQRAWRHTSLRPVAFLTAVPVQGARIDGMMCTLEHEDWADLDAREYAYTRQSLVDQADEGLNGVAIYAIEADRHVPPSARHPILLSYLDVVVQGYVQHFGPEGVARFFRSTQGWDAPILNDRAAPRYPRHRRLDDQERALVDAWLVELGCDLRDM